MNFRLQDAINKYLEITGGYGKPAPLSAFGLSQTDTERVFGAIDEDYHINRYVRFTSADGAAYNINGFPQTHITLDFQIETLL